MTISLLFKDSAVPLLLLLCWVPQLECGAQLDKGNGLFKTPVCPATGDAEFSEDAGRCCSKCPPGQGVSRPCSSYNDTVCERCKLGVTYSPSDGQKVAHQQHCVGCSPSPENAVVSRQCNLTHDTQWECKRGFFYDTSRRACVLCHTCPDGWGISAPCGARSNTNCIKCPEGTYSSAESAAKSCVVCTKCSSNQITLNECSSTQDTVCYELKKPSKAPGTVSPHARSEERPSIAGSAADFPTVPLYCAILGTVVVGLLLYVVIRCRSSRRHIVQEHCKSALKTDLIVRLDGSCRKAGVTSNSQFCEMPVSKRKEVALLLHKPDLPKEQNWQGLSKELGFSLARIGEFKGKAEKDGCMPAYSMLNEWSNVGRSDGGGSSGGGSSTVGALALALKRIGRTDAMLVLLRGCAAIRNRHDDDAV